VLIYFKALTTAGGGLLSAYSLTQKGLLLLGVPGGALANMYLREQGLAETRGALQGSVTAAVRAVIPLVIVAPIFALASFGLLCGIYHTSPTGPLGRRLAPACAAGAALTGLSLCASLLPLARTGARQMVVGALFAPVVAVATGVVILLYSRSDWTVGAPFLGAGVTGLLTLMWMASRTGEGFTASGFLFAVSLILTPVSAAVLASPAVGPAVAFVQSIAELLIGRLSVRLS
ncbi:MAG: hypothetical protein ACRDQZ_11100, partial [Mycobacteriales bacterium]